MVIRQTATALALALALAAAAIAVMACTNGGTGASVADDRSVLTAFYHATGGADWTNSEGWLSDGPLDEWHGVATDVQGCCEAEKSLTTRLRSSIALRSSSPCEFMRLCKRSSDFTSETTRRS